MLTKNDLIYDLEKLGLVRGDVLNVKVSLRSIGEIDGGVNTLIDALLDIVGPEGTLVTDSFVSVRSPFTLSFWRNVVDQDTPSYAGGLANAILNYPGVARSNHPVQKFALLGAQAQKLAAAHNAGSYAYEILNEMARTGGKNLKIGDDKKVPGVGTTHVAIGLEKIRQKRPFAGVRYKDKSGNIKSFYLDWAGACVEALFNLNQLYDCHPDAIIGRGKVGKADAKLTSMGTTLQIELEALRDNPAKFLRCGNASCVSCKLSWEHHNDKFWGVIKSSLSQFEFRDLLRALRIKFFFRFKP
jgi:aminoglycoside N3'-acetyltransferase